MRMTLGVRNLSGLVANLRAQSEPIQKAVREAVKKGGEQMHDAAYSLCPIDTGFMREHLELEFTPQGLGFEIGWKDEDFEKAGLPFYPPFVVFGTVNQAPQDPLTPAFNEISSQLVSDISNAMKKAVG